MFYIYDADGVTERVGPNTRNGVILGIANTGKSNGSLVDARFSRGVPFIAAVMATEGANIVVPDVAISGTTLSWTFKVSGANYNQPCRIVYGYR